MSAFDLKFTSNALSDELSDTSLLLPLSDPSSTARAQDVVAAAQADYARLISVMYDRGFFAPQVSILINGREAALLSPVRPIDQIRTVEVRVSTGPAFKFGRARIAPVPQNAGLPDAFISGETATTRILKDTVEAGVTSWRALGYAKAGLASQSITARHGAARLDADIQLDPGPQLRFGSLRVSGNTRMRSARIAEIAGLPKDKIFDPEEVDRAGTRLRRSGVFASISLTEAENISLNDRLDIEAQVTESKPRRFGFGAELSTQEGLGLSGFWLHRNLLGGGERLRLGAEIMGIGGTTGGTDYELTLAFSRPATFGSDTDFFTNAVISSLNEPNFSSDRVSIEAGVHRYATPEREYSLGVGYTAANTMDTFGTRSYRILTLPLSAEFDYRDDDLNATKGYYAKASLTPFLNLRGTTNGARGFIDTRAYRSLGADKRMTFAVRGQLGFVAGPSLRNAPADLLFYSGGGGTVRGHNYQSLGVDQGNWNTIGGASFIGLSGEVRVKTGEKLSVVGFYDTGFVGSKVVPRNRSGNWHSGAGLGVRYDTGIGPIRFDVAAPVGTPLRAKNVKLYIGIGQSF
jgi:translocation and assembly module TamA